MNEILRNRIKTTKENVKAFGGLVVAVPAVLAVIGLNETLVRLSKRNNVDKFNPEGKISWYEPVFDKAKGTILVQYGGTVNGELDDRRRVRIEDFRRAGKWPRRTVVTIWEKNGSKKTHSVSRGTKHIPGLGEVTHFVAENLIRKAKS